jgi:hypothetical protein
MGAEPTEMLMASLKQRNARQPPRPAQVLPPPQPKQPQTQGARGRKGKKAAKRITTADAAQTAAQWGQFTENIGRHDEQLHLEKLSTTGQPASGMVIQDVYQPTALVNGQRAGGGAKVVQQVQMSYSQVAAAVLTNGQAAQVGKLIPDIQAGISGLSLTNGSTHQAHGVQPTDGFQGSTPSAVAALRNLTNGANEGATAGRKSPTKAAGKGQHLAVQQPPIQQPPIPEGPAQQVPVHHLPVQQSPVQQPLIQPAPAQPTQTRSYMDDLIDLSPSAESNGNLQASADYTVTPHLLAQFAPSVASPGISVSNGMPMQQVSPPAAPVQWEQKEEKNSGPGKEEKEELLIEL